MSFVCLLEKVFLIRAEVFLLHNNNDLRALSNDDLSTSNQSNNTSSRSGNGNTRRGDRMQYNSIDEGIRMEAKNKDRFIWGLGVMIAIIFYCVLAANNDKVKDEKTVDRMIQHLNIER